MTTSPVELTELVSNEPAKHDESEQSVTPAPKHVPTNEFAPTETESINHTIRVTSPHLKPILLTETDVDDFLDAYRRKLMDAIEEGKRILL